MRGSPRAVSESVGSDRLRDDAVGAQGGDLGVVEARLGQDLARVVGITDSGASRRLNQMIKAGLIERFLCASDRRGVYALMTDKGKATYLKAHAVFVRSLERNLKQLEPGEAELVQTALSRLSSK